MGTSTKTFSASRDSWKSRRVKKLPVTGLHTSNKNEILNRRARGLALDVEKATETTVLANIGIIFFFLENCVSAGKRHV